jgi:hypothetical protein
MVDACDPVNIHGDEFCRPEHNKEVLQHRWHGIEGVEQKHPDADDLQTQHTEEKLWKNGFVLGV